MAAKKTATTMTLATVLDLNEASALQRALVDARGGDLVIDASGVERAGVQCIQVLAAAARMWRADARALSFSALSDAFSRTLALVGVEPDHLIAPAHSIAKESH